MCAVLVERISRRNLVGDKDLKDIGTALEYGYIPRM